MNPQSLFSVGRFDTIVIGGGAAGAVVASRLSEDPNRQVLLLEAGTEPAADSDAVRAVRNANQAPAIADISWKIPTFIKGFDTGGKRIYEAGRVMGGSSSINTVQAFRGAPEDYDEWASYGGDEWSWANVLPYFRKLENDQVGSDSLHGRDGPMPITRETWEQLTPLQKSLFEACRALGYPETPDHNDPSTTGVGVIPKNVVDGVRMSASDTYLKPARQRPNLHVVTGAMVHRLLWNAFPVCDGVELEKQGELMRFHADRVVVCAGAVNTPALLMRSGLGDARSLEALGIQVRHHLAGIGENLMDHPVVGIFGVPYPHVSQRGEPLRQVALRYTSHNSPRPNDMHICMMAGLNVDEMFPGMGNKVPTIAGLSVCNNRSASRGSIRLVSADPKVLPQVAINCLGDAGDVAPLMEGVRLAWKLIQHSALRDKFAHVIAWSDAMINSDVALQQAVKAFVRPADHMGGSARMGLASDPAAVVDAGGRIHGVDNVWIADASVMPRIPTGPTHLATLMIAEKISEVLRRNA